MKEVAEASGFSASTVCRALRSNPQIPAATREHIQKTAESLGYLPDPLLSALASRRRGKVAGSEITTIAYVTNFFTANQWQSNPFYLRIFEGARARARQLGYQLEHHWLREPGMTGRRLSRILQNRGISALCVAPTPQVRGHLPLDWARFSCVTVGYSLMRPNLHRTAPHHFHGILLAVRELRRLGYRRIGFCLFSGTSKRVDELWLAGVLLCQKNLLDLKLSVFLFDDRNMGDIAGWARKEKLDVVIGGEPVILQELKRGNAFPSELDYVTVNWAREEPEVAGIDQRADQVGAAAIDLVIAQMHRGERGVPEVPITTMVEGRWVMGQSLTRGQHKAGSRKIASV